VELGKWKKASVELDRAEASLRKAHHVACDAEPVRAPASAKAPARKAKKRRK
jgi:hypothetical protein